MGSRRYSAAMSTKSTTDCNILLSLFLGYLVRCGLAVYFSCNDGNKPMTAGYLSRTTSSHVFVFKMYLEAMQDIVSRKVCIYSTYNILMSLCVEHVVRWVVGNISF